MSIDLELYPFLSFLSLPKSFSICNALIKLHQLHKMYESIQRLKSAPTKPKAVS